MKLAGDLGGPPPEVTLKFHGLLKKTRRPTKRSLRTRVDANRLCRSEKASPNKKILTADSVQALTVAQPEPDGSAASAEPVNHYHALNGISPT